MNGVVQGTLIRLALRTDPAGAPAAHGSSHDGSSALVSTEHGGVHASDQKACMPHPVMVMLAQKQSDSHDCVRDFTTDDTQAPAEGHSVGVLQPSWTTEDAFAACTAFVISVSKAMLFMRRLRSVRFLQMTDEDHSPRLIVEVRANHCYPCTPHRAMMTLSPA